MSPASCSVDLSRKGDLNLGKVKWEGYNPLELKTEGGELIAQVSRQMFRGDQHLDVYKKDFDELAVGLGKIDKKFLKQLRQRLIPVCTYKISGSSSKCFMHMRLFVELGKDYCSLSKVLDDP